MMVKYKITLLFSCILLLSLLSCNNETKTNFYIASGPIQGTIYNVKYEFHEDLSDEIDSLLHVFNKSLSNFDNNSTISKINRNEINEVDSLFKEMFLVAKEVYHKTNGAFDITVAPIANFWSFGWEKSKPEYIDEDEINDILSYVGMSKVKIIDNKIVKSKPEIEFIGSAIAKGQSVDYVSDFLKNKGVENLLIEIGGEIYCNGLNHNGVKWRIGIDKPIEGSGYIDRENQLIIQLSDRAIATSGNYRQFIEMKGEKLGHSLDPRTGYPANNNLLSVTVIANRCIYADAYATAFMVMGLQESIELAESLNDIEAYFIYEDEDGQHQDVFTSGFKAYITD